MTEKNLYRLLPKVDEVLEDIKIEKLLEELPRRTVMDVTRLQLEKIREAIKAGLDEEIIREKIHNIIDDIYASCKKEDEFKLRRVINATGVVIHTNLGRSIIPKDIMDNISEIATNYSNLEFDLENGKRGSRYSHLEDIVCKITGGESAMVVNNNAAAVMLVLSALAKDKEVIVSRGELIEIGGSFRIPDVMEQSGAKLVDIGTTNKTHLWDYENAITEETGALLKVHTSNYRVMGFTSAVDSEELYSLKEKYDLPLIEDLGSGVLIDLSKFGLEYEPTVQDSLRKGVDVVTFSGDKLLGGPQAGIIVGKKEYIDKMKKNPLTRAFRVDKFTISALEGVFRYYLDEKNAIENIPTIKMLSYSLEDLDRKADALKDLLLTMENTNGFNICVEDDYSEVGGGSLPMERMPTRVVKLWIDGVSTQSIENQLREAKIPVIGRLYKDRIIFDPRTIGEDEFEIIKNNMEEIINRHKGVE